MNLEEKMNQLKNYQQELKEIKAKEWEMQNKVWQLETEIKNELFNQKHLTKETVKMVRGSVLERVATLTSSLEPKQKYQVRTILHKLVNGASKQETIKEVAIKEVFENLGFKVELKTKYYKVSLYE